MENNRIKIWKYIGLAAAVAAVCLICWYFRSILVYIACAIVVSLIGRPFKILLCRIRFGRFVFPQWLATLLTICLILGVLCCIGMLISPLVMQIAHQISIINMESLSYYLKDFNRWCTDLFPRIGPDFRVEEMVLNQIESLVSVGTVSSVVGSVSGFVADAAIGIFSVAFMSFFFINDSGLITRVLVAMVPDSYRSKVAHASSRTSRLLSRYFIGLIIESSCIAVLNGIGLTLIGGMPTDTAILVAVLSGIFNVIPYVGPLTGELLAVMMGMVTYVDCSFNGSFGFYLLILLVICLTTQLIDNYVFQPVIYSNSVKAHPLEIFIVILMAAKVWGILGLIVAIPGYTVLRVILSEFFPQARIVKLLTQKM